MKKFFKFLVTLIIILLIVFICFNAYTYFTEGKFAIEIGRRQELNITNDIESAVVTPMFSIGNYPRVDGSTATIPLSKAFIKAFTGDKTATVTHNTTHNAYVNLINKKADLILVTEPSEDEKKLANDNNFTMEVTPVVNEGFVFFVNEKNPVQSLSLEQIQDIYAGKITNWKDVGGDDALIKAYQREPNSGSQTGMLSLVMKNKTLMTAPQEDIIKDMSSIVNLVSSYDNGKYSIGYSFYYYATTMYDDIDSSVTDRIKFLGVNGVKPSEKTIKDASYPIRTNYYIVTDKNASSTSEAQILKDAMLSDAGQKVAKEAGYVPLR